LFSLEHLISKGEALNLHMPFPILAYPFLDFFGQVMHFCKSASTNLIDTYRKSLQTFSFIVAYQQPLENACPTQVPWKLSSKPNISHLTIDFRAVITMIKFNPSSST
jgi:hypothetical protein